MANEHTTLVSLFDDIANAIRERAGGTGKIVADTFPTAIRNIPNIVKGGVYIPNNYTTKYFTVAHNLGVVPNFGLCMAYPFDQKATDEFGNNKTISNAFFGFYKDTVFYRWDGQYTNFYHKTTDITQSWETQKANAGTGNENIMPLKWYNANSSTISLGGTGTDYCYAFNKDITYHWFVGRLA